MEYLYKFPYIHVPCIDTYKLRGGTVDRAACRASCMPLTWQDLAAQVAIPVQAVIETKELIPESNLADSRTAEPKRRIPGDGPGSCSGTAPARATTCIQTVGNITAHDDALFHAKLSVCPC